MFASFFFLPLQDGDDYHEFLFNQCLMGFGIQKRWESCTRRFKLSCVVHSWGVREGVFCLPAFCGPFSTFGSSSLFSCLYLPVSTSHYLHAPKFYHSSTAMFARMGDIRDRETSTLQMAKPKAGFPKGIIRLAPASRFRITSSSEGLDVWVLIVHTGLPQDRSSVELYAERQGTSGAGG